MEASVIGKRISEYRKRAGLTQAELARHLSVTPQAVSKWERGINFPDLALTGDLASVLGVSAGALLLDGRTAGEDVLLEIAEVSREEGKRNRRKRFVDCLTLVLIACHIVLYAIAYLTSFRVSSNFFPTLMFGLSILSMISCRKYALESKGFLIAFILISGLFLHFILKILY